MIVVREHPESRRAPESNFTGTVHVDQLAVADSPSRLRAFSVHFQPGARSAWHRHPFGQLLHVTEGVGRVQSGDGAVQEIRSGDTIVTLPGEWHWHGAAPGHHMTHIAMQEADDDQVDAYWGRHVSDDEYCCAPGRSVQ